MKDMKKAHKEESLHGYGPIHHGSAGYGGVYAMQALPQPKHVYAMQALPQPKQKGYGNIPVQAFILASPDMAYAHKKSY